MEASRVGLVRQMRKRNSVSLPQRAHSNQCQMRPGHFNAVEVSPTALGIDFRVPNATMRSAGE